MSICLIVTFSIVCKRRTEEECDLWNAAPVGRCQYEIRGNLCPQSQSCVRHSTSVDKSSNRAWRQIGILYYGWGGRIRCVASVGQKWRNPVHTSREGGRKDKGDYEARMPSIIRRSTPLWVYTQQRPRHNGLVRGSARRICSCSTKKPQRLQSIFDTWLTRFQIRIDKMCTNVYNLCIEMFQTLISDIHHNEQEFTGMNLQNKWIATVVDDGNYVMHSKSHN